MAQSEFPKWEWWFPKTRFGISYDCVPTELFSEINNALLTLAVSGHLDAAILVELHRLLDATAENCARLADLAKWDLIEEICDSYWSVERDIRFALLLLPRILSGSGDNLFAWRDLGDRVGSFLTDWGTYETIGKYPSNLRAILDDAARISSANLDRFESMPVLKGKVSAETYRNAMYAVHSIDQELIRGLVVGNLPWETWIVLDDKRQVLTFLGVEVRFNAFQESGGLDVLRVLINEPQKPISAPDILERAGLVAESRRATEYLCRFRKDLKTTQIDWPATFTKEPDKSWAEAAFIVADSYARTMNKSKETWYKLDLPPHRVMHVPVVLPS